MKMAFCMILLSVTVSARTHSQVRCTVAVDRQPLTEVFSQITRQTGYEFIYSNSELSKTGTVSLNVSDTDIQSILSMCLEGSGLWYVIEDNIVVITPKVQAPQPRPRSVPVSGTVVDQRGMPVVGASVIIKGTTTGTATDRDGKFTLPVPDPAASVLVVSFLGMTPREVRPGGQTTLQIVLEDDEQAIDEIVVTGLFERRKESFTGNAVTFTQDDLKLFGNQNILQSLRNLDPSFIISDNIEFGSDPNRMPEIQIRGASSLSDLKGEYTGNPNEPLFILDGFQATSTQIFDLDMNRVSSVTILKDAAAKAIYGSKAANGVVVVETTLPKAGRLRVSYTGDLNIEAPDLSSYDLCNAEEKLQVELAAGRYTNTSSRPRDQHLREQYNEILKAVREGADTYWLSKPLRVGVGHKHSLHLEGGDEHMRYGADVVYNNVSGVMKGSGRETISGSINLSYRYRNLIFRNILSVTFNRADDSPYGSFSEYTRLNPYWTAYDENGNIKKFLGTYSTAPGGTPERYANPLYNATVGTKNFSKYTQVTENFYAEWQVLPSLKMIGRFGFTYTGDSREDFYPGDHTRFYEMTGDDYFKRGSYAISDGQSKALNADVTANYTKLFGKHLLFANAGWSLNSSSDISHGMRAQGFLNNRVDDITFAKQYEENGTPYGSESVIREVGFIGAANYSYDDRYLADVSFRTNASSVFGSDNRWGSFWSLGVGWNLHNERFMRDSRVLNMFKLRGSIGYTGSQNFDSFQAMRTYKFFSDRTYDNIAGAYLMSLANDKLKWQQTRDINVGFDAQLFSRLNIRLDAYVSTTDNLLIDFTLPPSTGFTSYKQNIGVVENKGFEATLNWQVYRNAETQSFVSVFASAAHNNNKIKEISAALKSYNDEQTADTEGLTAPLTLYEEGQSMTAIWAVQSLGIDPVYGRELYLKKDGSGTTYDWDPQDQIIAGDTNPKLRGNFGVNAEYKGFGLALSFRYTFGGDYYNSTLVDRVENVNVAYNVDRRVFEGTWQNVGDVVPFKQITNSPTTTKPTTRFVEKNNELTLASLNLSYDFKNLNLKKIGMERLKCSFYMVDLFRLSTVKAERGLSYPFARTFSFSLSATF